MATNKMTYERLIDFASGDCSTSEAETISVHIATDAKAAGVVARFRTVVETTRADDSQAPAADLIAQVKSLYGGRRAAARGGLLETAARIIAELTYDSRPQLALTGVRGAGTAYQLAFDCEFGDIDLEVDPRGAEDGLCRVTGQISPRRAAARVTTIMFCAAGTDEIQSTVRPNQQGLFIASVAAGIYDMRISAGPVHVVLPGVEVGG